MWLLLRVGCCEAPSWDCPEKQKEGVTVAIFVTDQSGGLSVGSEAPCHQSSSNAGRLALDMLCWHALNTRDTCVSTNTNKITSQHLYTENEIP